MQWIKLKNFTNNTTLLLGCVYVPPEISKCASRDSFDDIEREMSTFSKDDYYKALICDFNSRTGKLSDILVPDIKLNDILHNDLLHEIEYLYDYQKLSAENISLERFSQDNKRHLVSSSLIFAGETTYILQRVE